jgi:glutamate-1-semialdehyde 2,1-aminomutase
MFSPKPPRDGADVIATRRGDLETLLHAFYMNKGVLVTPFHTMLLMCPATTNADADRHTEVFTRFAEMALDAGVV